MTGTVASPAKPTGLPEYIGREVAHMTMYETITVVLEIAGLLLAAGNLLIAFLTFLDKRNSKKK
ncbi:MAG: hypothetical protein LUE29_09290 [Lachnospiraceae bacterium]|nr:hypothetical protein [Lachnospiraceae bacterium]